MKTIKSLTEAEIAELPKLPVEWGWVKIGDHSFVTKLAGFEYTKHVKYQEKGDIPVIRAQNVSKEGFIPRNFVYVDKETMEKLPRSRIRGGEILMVFVGAGLGNVGIVPYNKEYFLGPNVAKIDLGKNLNNKYVLLFLSSILGFGNISGMSKATAQGSISMSNIREVAIPFVALEEQRAIVSKIELLFSELDNGIANLKLAQEQLKVYRQAVLKKAFEGELTKKWREQQTDLPDAGDLLEQIRRERGETTKISGKKVKPVKPLTEEELVELPKLPERWGWVKFVEFCSIQRGYDLPLKNIIEGKYPVFTSGGLAGYHNEFKAMGPCLVTGRSGSVGNIHFLEVDKYWPHNTVLFVTDFHGNYPKYVYYFFLQFNFKSFSASTAVPTLDRKMLYNELVKLPPFGEQQAIVQEIETRLSVCDKIEQDIKENLEKAEALRQSILKKAFEGKLLNERELAEVRGAEDWEPAEVLLERIKDEKEGNGKKGKQGRS